MPIYEAVAFDGTDLTKPLGVLFDPPCITKDADLALWQELLPVLQDAQGEADKHVCFLVQARSNRPWSETAHNYVFEPDKDYLIAAYIVAESFGEPWVPGALTKIWLDKQLNEFEYYKAPGRFEGQQPKSAIRRVDAARHRAINPEVMDVFQASDKGCGLSQLGVHTRVNVLMKGGDQSYAEVVDTTLTGMSDKYGWQGKFLGVYSAGPMLNPGDPGFI